MPSETFFCPNCRARLTKSAQAYVLGEIASSGARYIGLGNRAEHVTCPACGQAIDAQRMVRGDYDGAKGGWIAPLGIVLGIGAGIAVSYVFALPWWAGLIAGLLILFSTIGYLDNPARSRRA
ncbi:MAG: hypothetical protein KGQ94_00430 [Alphaproteobacteria bacterium]|nr:hypothetical protein [Alphaproteobacteria bacterium]